MAGPLAAGRAGIGGRGGGVISGGIGILNFRRGSVQEPSLGSAGASDLACSFASCCWRICSIFDNGLATGAGADSIGTTTLIGNGSAATAAFAASGATAF